MNISTDPLIFSNRRPETEQAAHFLMVLAIEPAGNASPRRMPAGIRLAVADGNDAERSVLERQPFPGHIIEMNTRSFVFHIRELDIDQQIRISSRMGNRYFGIAPDETIRLGDTDTNHNPEPCRGAAGQNIRV